MSPKKIFADALKQQTEKNLFNVQEAGWKSPKLCLLSGCL